MPRFLHLADVHLGHNQYNCPERTRDFYRAFRDALEKYAIAPQVDFVLIVGDLFEQRQILPGVLNQAQLCLDRLKDAGIPVFAIEGNHDYEPYGSATSWLRYLSQWEKLILLKPDNEGILDPWDPQTKQGSYIDLDCGVRIIGSRWYGATAPQAIEKLGVSIQNLPPGPDSTVMMFHHGLEGQIARYKGALRYQDLLPLKTAGVDYLALGHIHKNYTAEGWIFNPGSIEANSVIENQNQNPRGVYLVNLSSQGKQAELQRDYWQRPIVRLSVKADPRQTPADLEAAAIATVQAATDQGQTQAAIVELRLQGSVGFNRLDLNIRELQTQLQDRSQALVFLIKYDVTGVEYQTYVGDQDAPPSRSEIERTVFMDLLAANTQYKDQTERLSQGLIDLKERVLKQEVEVDLYGFIETLLPQGSPPTEAPAENPADGTEPVLPT